MDPVIQTIREKVSSFTDEQLFNMLTINSQQYTSEALAIGQEEADKRGGLEEMRTRVAPSIPTLEMLPEQVPCIYCQAMMELDTEERIRRTFNCANCERENDLSQRIASYEKEGGSRSFFAEGRITRSTYWSRWLLSFVISFIVGFVSATSASLVSLGLITQFAITIFMVIQGVKRMHDVDRSGWYILIPIYNLVLTLTDGTVGANSYGDDPKDR